MRGFLHDVLKDGDVDKLTDYVSTETYIQHSPQVADGLEGLGAYIAELATQGQTLRYQDIHIVMGSGSFVAALSEARLGDSGLAIIDLFRVADGRIVEHWDVIEEITPEDTWVNSGKF